MAANINDILTRGLQYNGARTARFTVQTTLPASVQGASTNFEQKLMFTCRASSIPSFQVGTVQAPYFGRIIKLSGDRIWNDWQITVMLDQDYTTRVGFEAWNNGINALEQNIMLTGASQGGNDFQGYKSTMNIVHYGLDNNPIASYDLIGAWPAQLGPIQLNWAAQNQISEFDVVIPFDDMLPTTGFQNPLVSGQGYDSLV